MTRICAWCSSNLGNKPGEASESSHGICDKCETRMQRQIQARAGAEVNAVASDQLDRPYLASARS
jgi:hypothetical protein